MIRPSNIIEQVEGSARMRLGEFLFTEDNFEQIATIMRIETGISLDKSKFNLVYSRIAKRVRTLGLRSFSEYCAFISETGGEIERDQMIAALTTNVTRFFREPHHFEHLKINVLPELIKHTKSGGRVRLWSAACSSGQEPYSMALTILSLLPDAAKFDIKILATDIDSNMLEIGKKGIYEASALQDVPIELSSRWFRTVQNTKGSQKATDELRSLVNFRKLNLIGSWPMQGRFHAIFCRNVAIYFEEETKVKMWRRMLTLLDDDGALYVGHSERISGEAQGSFRSEGITTYRRQARTGEDT